MTKEELIKRTDKARRQVYALANTFKRLHGFSECLDEYDPDLTRELEDTARRLNAAYDLLTRREIPR